MKNSSAIKISITIAPLFMGCVWGTAEFFTTSVISFFDDKTEICWESAILAAVCYGFIAIRNFMENSHFENLNQ
jgi:hypothetical protein